MIWPPKEEKKRALNYTKKILDSLLISNLYSIVVNVTPLGMCPSVIWICESTVFGITNIFIPLEKYSTGNVLFSKL